MFTKTGLYAVAVTNVRFHPARHHIAGGKLALLGFIIRHKAVLFCIQQQAAIAATALSNQYTRRENSGGMKLHRFHIAQFGNAGFKCDSSTNALINYGVGGYPVNTAEAAGSNTGDFSQVNHEFTGNEVSYNRTLTAAVIMEQSNGLHALVDFNALGNGLITHGIQHGVAGAVGHIVSAPFGRATKVARGNQPV